LERWDVGGAVGGVVHMVHQLKVIHAHVQILLVDDGGVKNIWEEVGGQVEVGGISRGLIIGIQEEAIYA